MANSNSMAYAKRAKQGFFIGFALFAVGALGEVLSHTVLTGLPAYGQTLLFDAEVAGVLIALLAPLVFGIILPLTE